MWRRVRTADCVYDTSPPGPRLPARPCMRSTHSRALGCTWSASIWRLLQTRPRPRCKAASPGRRVPHVNGRRAKPDGSKKRLNITNAARTTPASAEKRTGRRTRGRHRDPARLRRPVQLLDVLPSAHRPDTRHFPQPGSICAPVTGPTNPVEGAGRTTSTLALEVASGDSGNRHRTSRCVHGLGRTPITRPTFCHGYQTGGTAQPRRIPARQPRLPTNR